MEKANHVAAQRFWRALPDEVTVEEAQARLDKWCATRDDIRLRATADGRSTVQALAELEPLRPVPEPYPAVLTVARVVSAQALVAYAGNRYSVPPELHGSTVTVSLRLGATHLDIATLPTPGRHGPVPTVIARHQLAPAGAGATIREVGHVTALTEAALAAFTTAAPHRRKERRPPSPAARAEADRLRDEASTQADSVVVDLARYAAAAAGRNTLRPAALRPLTRGPVRHPQERHEGDEPAMTTTQPTIPSAPSTPAQASLYQQLRGHLSVLKLHDAAEHLPAVLDAETAEGLSLTAALERLLAVEVDATEARRLAGRLRFASLPTPATLAEFDYDAAAETGCRTYFTSGNVQGRVRVPPARGVVRQHE